MKIHQNKQIKYSKSSKNKNILVYIKIETESHFIDEQTSVSYLLKQKFNSY